MNARNQAAISLRPQGTSRFAMAAPVKRVLLAASLLLAPAATVGCGGPEESVTPTVASRELGPAELDRDPLALLPGGMIGFLHLEAAPTFATPFGPSLAELLRQLAPLPPNAGFVVERDLKRVYLGMYSMAGADLAGVAVGRFDENQIRLAAQAAVSGQTHPVGVLVQSVYAGRPVYTVGNLGFCLLSAQTALFGNETGIRRALDRIREGRAVNRLPSWTRELLAEEVPIGFGLDLRATAMSDSIRQQAPFVEKLEAMRGRGNFAAPGLNLVGSLTYPTPEAAAIGAQKFGQMREMLAQSGFLMALLNIAQPIERLEAKTNGSEADFVVTANGATLGRLINQLTPTIVSTARAGLSK